MECEVEWLEAGDACDAPFMFGVDCCPVADDVGDRRICCIIGVMSSRIRL